MAYAEHNDYHKDMGAGRATGGAIGIFAAMGLGLAILGFVAAFGLRGVSELDASNVAAGVSALLIGVFPFMAAPILSVLAGTWAGQATKSAGSGSIAGAVGGLLGPIVLFILVGLGFLLGAAVAGVDLAAIQWPPNVAVPPGVENLAAYLASLSGILYLVANIVMGAVAGAIIGALARPAVVVERREVARGPARI